MKEAILKKGRELPFVGRHPWVFSGAVQNFNGGPSAGDIVKVKDAAKNFVAWGIYNPHSQICLRLYSWDEKNIPDGKFFYQKVEEAVFLRRELLRFADGRMVNSEGDGLSGLVVDSYGDYLSVQINSYSIYTNFEAIKEALVKIFQPKGIYLKSEKSLKKEEGFTLVDNVCYGDIPLEIIIEENGVSYKISITRGQKTGFYYDQRYNRLLAQKLAENKNCLDVCCYTGGFALNMAYGKAKKVTAVDVSDFALTEARANAALNNLSLTCEKSDAYDFLGKQQTNTEHYDLVVLDPPKFARNAQSEKTAIKGYLSLNELGLKNLAKNGILITCSCSGRITPQVYQQILFSAALKAKRELKILHVLGAGPDHPVNIYCPESAYLKCFVCVVN